MTERDKEHFRKIGRWKAESHREALAEHLALSGHDRLLRTLELMLAGPIGKPKQDESAPAIYERARQRGLYRG